MGMVESVTKLVEIGKVLENQAQHIAANAGSVLQKAPFD